MEQLKAILKENIRYYRNVKGYTQEQLAERSQLSTSYIAAIETGMKIPSLKSTVRISQELGLDVSQLLSTREEQQIQEFVRQYSKGLGGVEKKLDLILTILQSADSLEQ